MKRFLSILLLLFLLTPIDKIYSQLKLGAFAGPNLTSIREKHYDETKKGPSYLGYNLGIASELVYDQKLQFDFDVYYNFKKAKEIYSGGGLGGWGAREILYQFDMFFFCALVNYGITKKNDFSLIFGGAYYNIFSAKGSGFIGSQILGSSPTYEIIDDSTIQEYIGRMSGVGIQLGLEKSFQLKNQREINLKGIVSLAKIFSIELHIEFLKIVLNKNKTSD